MIKRTSGFNLKNFCQVAPTSTNKNNKIIFEQTSPPQAIVPSIRALNTTLNCVNLLLSIREQNYFSCFFWIWLPKHKNIKIIFDQTLPSQAIVPSIRALNPTLTKKQSSHIVVVVVEGCSYKLFHHKNMLCVTSFI